MQLFANCKFSSWFWRICGYFNSWKIFKIARKIFKKEPKSILYCQQCIEILLDGLALPYRLILRFYSLFVNHRLYSIWYSRPCAIFVSGLIIWFFKLFHWNCQPNVCNWKKWKTFSKLVQKIPNQMNQLIHILQTENWHII